MTRVCADGQVKLTFAQLVAQVADQSCTSRRQARLFLKGLLAVIEEGLERDGMVAVRGLGRFQLRAVAEHRGRNPRTGDALVVPAHRRVAFVAESQLKRQLRDDVQRAPLNPDALLQSLAANVFDVMGDVELTDVVAWAEGPMPARRPQESMHPVVTTQIDERSGRGAIWGSRTLLGSVGILALVVGIAIFGPWQSNGSVEVLPAPRATTASEPPALAAAPAVKEHPRVTGSPTTAPTPEREHRVERGETLSLLAKASYGDTSLWPILFAANQAQLSHPDRLVVGTSLRVPALAGSADALTQSDQLLLHRSLSTLAAAMSRLGDALAARHYRRQADRYLKELGPTALVE